MADQVRAYYDTFDAFTDTIAQAVEIVNTIDIGMDKSRFSALLKEVTVSLKPDPQSEFFNLFFGNDWEMFLKIQAELLEQLEISKKKSKRIISYF